MRAAVTVAAFALCSLAAADSRGEEGLFTARLAGGVSSVEPDLPRLGGMAAGGLTLGLTSALDLAVDATFVGHSAYDTLGLGIGARLAASLGDWTHPYLLLEPQLLLVGDGPGAGSPTVDAALRAALGIDYLLMWGLGVTLEVGGTVPAGLGAVERWNAASVGVVAGLYMEF